MELSVFEQNRRRLWGIAYRMLGAYLKEVGLLLAESPEGRFATPVWVKGK
jgi:hypothetical protein